MTKNDADVGYDEHLVFGISWDQPTRVETRKLLNTLGLPSHGFVTIGNHAILDEMTVLELGRHVEMEFGLQALAADGVHWADLGDYLGRLMTADLEDDDDDEDDEE